MAAWILFAIVLVVALGLAWRLTREIRAHAGTLNALKNAQMMHEKTTATLKQLTAQHNTLLNNDSHAIIFADNQLRVLFANSAAETIFGIPTAGETLLQWTQDHQLVDVVTQTRDSLLGMTHQFNFGNQVFRLRIVPVTETSPPQLLLLLWDVSELQRLGRARRDLVANISHDLRTPISGIQLIAETLLNGALSDKKMAPVLTEKILDEIEILTQINQELMDLSLIESGRMPIKLVRCNLTKQVKKVAKRMQAQAARKNLSLTLDLPPKIRVLADKAMLARVLMNLTHNAIKFTETGGVTIHTIPADDPAMVCVVVTDTGVGMSAEAQSRVFERFFKIDDARSRGEFMPEKHSGTGLGLAIARHIVEAHGGKIWLESMPGQGTAFYFTLPRDELLYENFEDDDAVDN